MKENKLIPHFVADRPMSLRILSGMNFETHPVKVGIMLQACTTNNFRKMAAEFPCGDKNYCGVVNGKCPYDGNITKCKKGLSLRENVTTIADSGVFTKEGATLSYSELFQRYNQMKVKRGIMLDVLRDMDGTIESAELALEAYSLEEYRFKLIGVAQGKNPEEYLKCYNKLKDMGFEEIAIGGLLTKKENTVRFASSNKERISEIVSKINLEWPDDRCFTLGVYNPKRHEFLEGLGVNAADYKGWIFQYKKRFQDPLCHHIDRINQTRFFIEKNILSLMSGNEISHTSINCDAEQIKNQVSSLNKKIVVENNENKEKERAINKVVIISCGKLKLQSSECFAKDAYIGKSFLLKRKYAEISKNPFFILSAKYGLIRPEQVIDPNYNKTITSKKDCFEMAENIKKQIPYYFEFSIADEILFLGPELYFKALEYAIQEKEGLKIQHLTKGLNQGKSQQLIKELISKEAPEST
ncbi:DUF6884 domain-containing protein [Methanosarcina sp.]|uniref:DUF6884 domain-containing protein n=1 Tax=Methanosarcina sp. TaxID=2213 RepID=UPI002C169676|nr:DUF6884 domain-containing protein [Methanosarcina sp.]HOW14045.1 hypothetical protein [Methanosarcina sp.]